MHNTATRQTHSPEGTSRFDNTFVQLPGHFCSRVTPVPYDANYCMVSCIHEATELPGMLYTDHQDFSKDEKLLEVFAISSTPPGDGTLYQ